MKNDIYDKFLNLDQNINIPKNMIKILEKINEQYYFGYNSNFQLLFIMKSEKSSLQLVKTEKLVLELNSPYLLSTSDEMVYCNLLCLKSNEEDEITLFLDLCKIFIRDNNSSSNDIYTLFLKLQSFFKENKGFSKSDIIGMFGELIAIRFFYEKFSINIAEYYRQDSKSKYDFNVDEKTKIEIKTTTKEDRVHYLCHDQFYNMKVDIFLLSIKLRLDDSGLNIKELYSSISDLFDFNLDSKFKIQRIVNLMDKEFESLKYSIHFAIDNIRTYYNKTLKDHLQNYPNYISDITYKMNFNSLDSFPIIDLSNILSSRKRK